jgi:hypothetical protein
LRLTRRNGDPDSGWRVERPTRVGLFLEPRYGWPGGGAPRVERVEEAVA